MFDAAAAHVRAPAGPGQARDRRRLHAGRARAAGDAARRARAAPTPARSRASPRRRRCRPTRRPSRCWASSRASRPPTSPSSASRTSWATGWCGPRRKARRAADVITEATSLGVGDFVVHADHGIGRFDGLTTITALGAPHDCLEIAYAEGAKLYLPVENIELLSRYGSADGVGAARPPRRRRLADAQGPPQAAHPRDRRRADQGRGAAPAARGARRWRRPPGEFDEFVARFPYERDRGPDGQHRHGAGGPGLRQADGPAGVRRRRLRQDRGGAAGPPSSRRWRASRWRWWCRPRCWRASTSPPSPSASRACPCASPRPRAWSAAKELAAVKAGIKEGTIDIVVGTHALLGKAIAFKRLGLLVVDEEQHFGVAHKERLKQLREDVHVLTLTATPIPRTLQLALVRRARAVADHHAAGRPPGRAHLHLAVRSRDRARGAAARALPRRAELLRGAAHRRPRGGAPSS